MFEKKKGYFKETANDAVMEKVDENGQLSGFQFRQAFKSHGGYKRMPFMCIGSNKKGVGKTIKDFCCFVG